MWFLSVFTLLLGLSVYNASLIQENHLLKDRLPDSGAMVNENQNIIVKGVVKARKGPHRLK